MMQENFTFLPLLSRNFSQYNSYSSISATVVAAVKKCLSEHVLKSYDIFETYATVVSELQV